MTKRRLSLKVRIPAYYHPRNEWRRALHASIVEAAALADVVYRPDDRLELVVTLYLSGDELPWHDVDNRLKDVMDAIQGRAGGPKAKRDLHPVVPNDHQIYKVTVEKKIAPPQSGGMGHLVIRKYNPGAARSRRPS